MAESPVKYVFVTGGVVSGLGKGITAASLGTLLKARGIKVSLQKCDPYLNVDPGTMSPFQHGEVFVTEDGAETDLDLGHYERFTDENLTRTSNVTTGADLRRRHQAGAARRLPRARRCRSSPTSPTRSRRASARRREPDAEVVIVEIGGTVGDIESLPFLEAIRQLRNDVGRENVLLHPRDPGAVPRRRRRAQDEDHPALGQRAAAASGSSRTSSCCRSNRPLTDDIREKIALYGGIPTEAVISAVDAGDIYKVPLRWAEGLDR